MKTTENKGFLTSPNAMGRSVAVKLPVAFQKANKINGFEHIFYGTALFNYEKTTLPCHPATDPAFGAARCRPRAAQVESGISLQTASGSCGSGR